MAIPERTVAAMLATVRDAALADDLPRAIVDGFEQVIGVDYVTYDEFGRTGTRFYANPAPPPEVAEGWTRHGHEHPSLADFRATGRGGTRRLSDVISQRRLRALGLWATVFRPLRIRHQLNLTLYASGSRVIGVGLSRIGRDFSDDERDVAELVRAELEQIVLAREGPPAETLTGLGLTAREAEILSLSFRRTSAEVARVLGISERTVEKHLEHVYAKLGVTGRRAAVAAALGHNEPRRGAGAAERDGLENR